jgi:hypothetical protein
VLRKAPGVLGPFESLTTGFLDGASVPGASRNNHARIFLEHFRFLPIVPSGGKDSERVF